MKNPEAAQIFAQIANLLEIKGENPFKVRAYEKAAQTIQDLPEDLASFREKQPLTKIPGIGESIAQKIDEILNTGKCQFHQDLLAEMSPGLIELLRIPEVGPKTVQLLYEQLGVSTVAELEKAVKKHLLRGLKRMGAKTEENILEGIARLRQQGERRPLAVAFPHAQEIVEALKAQTPVDQIEMAGSLRRMKDTIGDIDILVTSQQPEKVMEVFCSLPMVKKILAQGTTKSSVITNLDIQVDVRVLKPDCFGAALQYFTGSKAHNIKLRELAVKRGLKISEYGIFKVKGNKRLGGETEEEIYDALGLPCPPPEIREDMGEIEAARKNKLPKLVEASQIQADLHVHSDWSDGRYSIAEMAEAAQQLGYTYVAITDHSKGRGIANGLSEDRLLKQIEEIKNINKKLQGFALLAGTEVDIRKDGDLDFDDDLLCQLDFVIASVHSGFRMDANAMTDRTIRAMENPWVDVIGHPTGRIIGQREPYAVDMDRILEAAARLGAAMEVNAFPDRLDLKDVHCRMAKEMGVKLVIGTDAHSVEHLGLMTYGVATARRGWVEAKDLLNTLPLADFRKSLRRNKQAQPRRQPKHRAAAKSRRS